jgi:hypothetical protein
MAKSDVVRLLRKYPRDTNGTLEPSGQESPAIVGHSFQAEFPVEFKSDQRPGGQLRQLVETFSPAYVPRPESKQTLSVAAAMYTENFPKGHTVHALSPD